jgi:hypothetical protein
MSHRFLVAPGTPLALLSHNFKQDWLPGVAGPEPRLGFRFWGVNYKEGACTSPLFAFLPDLLHAMYFDSYSNTHRTVLAPRINFEAVISKSCVNRRGISVCQKSERPVGVPAARAWGMEGNAI